MVVALKCLREPGYIRGRSRDASMNNREKLKEAASAYPISLRTLGTHFASKQESLNHLTQAMGMSMFCKLNHRWRTTLI